ncbi:hypothetical protein [Achromobacter insolitus]|uniref:hypothetical protein n=1 Tax=Achromobacter insolitus TaxID=217204 RepID=UPI00241F48E2|nr:hypothetical protein [Achromobacter insolitus]
MRKNLSFGRNAAPGDLPANVTFASLFSRFHPQVQWRFDERSAMIASAIDVALRKSCNRVHPRVVLEGWTFSLVSVVSL